MSLPTDHSPIVCVAHKPGSSTVGSESSRPLPIALLRKPIAFQVVLHYRGLSGASSWTASHSAAALESGPRSRNRLTARESNLAGMLGKPGKRTAVNQERRQSKVEEDFPAVGGAMEKLNQNRLEQL